MATHQFELLDNSIARITLSSGPGNPMTPEFLDELNTRLSQLTEQPPRALILDAGDSKIFSGGFALPVIAHWKRKEIREFFANFLKALEQLILLPCPTFCALNGHAIAGGFIMSLGCDFRIVRKGNLKLGLSEVDLGVAVPLGTQLLFADRTCRHTATRYSMFGELFNSDDALKTGYAIASADDAFTKALEMATALSQKPGDGVRDTKVLYAKTLSRRVKAADESGLEVFLDSWFSKQGQQYIQALAEKLSR
jgi:enoyl-CoA hydratase/carnithine racemase